MNILTGFLKITTFNLTFDYISQLSAAIFFKSQNCDFTFFTGLLDSSKF